MKLTPATHFRQFDNAEFTTMQFFLVFFSLETHIIKEIQSNVLIRVAESLSVH